MATANRLRKFAHVLASGGYSLVTKPKVGAIVEADKYRAALCCKRCGHFLLPQDVEGHERWHDEPRR